MDANAPTSPATTPWDFRARGFVFGMIYGIAFFVGINLQYYLFGHAQPTYALIGERRGLAGIHAAAFLPVIFAVAGQGLRMWGTAYLSSGIVWNPSVTSGRLLLSGPYRYVRNPLYLGNMLTAIGIGMIGPPLTLLIVVIGVAIFTWRLISIEERYLASVYGQAYADYCNLVPRLLPRLTPAPVAADPRPPAWADGFWGEMFFLSFAIALLYNALFTWQSPNWSMWLILLVALAAQIVARRLTVAKPKVAA